jgi:hypothetical protein
MVVEVLMDTCGTVTPELPDRYRSTTPVHAPIAQLVEHSTDNRKTEDRNPLGVPYMAYNMDEFKKAFWEWFDNLPEKAKRSYQRSHLDVAEEYFKEFFYKKS